jgi:hypothetical protein
MNHVAPKPKPVHVINVTAAQYRTILKIVNGHLVPRRDKHKNGTFQSLVRKGLLYFEKGKTARGGVTQLVDRVISRGGKPIDLRRPIKEERPPTTLEPVGDIYAIGRGTQ